MTIVSPRTANERTKLLERKYNEAGLNPDEFIFFDDLIIPFHNDVDKICTDLSGGADSALLNYILCDHITKNNLNIEVHQVSHIRVWKNRPWQKPVRVGVHEKLKSMFPTIKFVVHENYLPPEIEMGTIGRVIPTSNGLKAGCQIEPPSFSQYVCATNGIKYKFGGVTRNPDDLQSHPKAAPNRNMTLEEVRPDQLVQRWGFNVTIYEPFYCYDKDMLMEKYFTHNILDLLKVTRSCEGQFDLLRNAELTLLKNGVITEEQCHGEDYYMHPFKKYKTGDWIPECGECYWCCERNWALDLVKEKLNITYDSF